MPIDPVCGTEVVPGEAAATTHFDGRTYFFCSEDCYQDFIREPEEFAAEAAELYDVP
jgi:YHS domain-containing protein